MRNSDYLKTVLTWNSPNKNTQKLSSNKLSLINETAPGKNSYRVQVPWYDFFSMADFLMNA